MGDSTRPICLLIKGTQMERKGNAPKGLEQVSVLDPRFPSLYTPNCNNVVIEKKQKAKKPNRNKLAM